MSIIYKMTFFRIKKIKGKEYAYIVENEWGMKGSRQKVIGYIGKVYRFKSMKNVGFIEYFKIENFQEYIENNESSKIIKDLVHLELFKFGIKDFSINLENIAIQKNNKNVVFLINEGFMCNITLKNLIEFKISGDERLDARLLARAFVEAGIKVPNEVFIGIFGKLYKTFG